MPRKPQHPFEAKYPSERFNYVGRPEFKTGNLHCCGVKEFHGTQAQYVFENRRSGRYSYEALPLKDLVEAFIHEVGGFDAHRPHWIFTDADDKASPGEALAKYIEENNLGTVLRSEYVHNHNSGNKVRVYLATMTKKAQNHVFG